MADEADSTVLCPTIDVHTHAVRGHFPPWEAERSLSPDLMIDHLKWHGIDKAVLLPLEAPDSFSEHKVGLPIDHEWSCVLYSICADLGFPVLLHLDFTLNTDSNGQPGLERLLRRFSNTTFIGHGPTFWAEISADFDRAHDAGNTTGKVVRGGSTDRLLADYPNLYADLSAMSAYSVPTRDPDFAADFLDRAWPKLMLGTDYLEPFQDLPIVEFVRTYPFSETARRAVMGWTAARLLGIGD